MEAGTPPANQARGALALQMSADSGQQAMLRRQPQGHNRRRSSVRTRHSHTVFNTTSFGGNRAHYQVPRGIFSPVSPAARSPRPRTRSVSRAESEEQLRLGDNNQQPSLPVIPEAEAEWKPSIVLGSPLWLEGEDLSRIEIADRKIAQRRLWVEHYRGAADFPDLLEQAIQERNLLDPANEENTKPKSSLASTHTQAIAERVSILRTMLESSHFPPEIENVSAAIAGYTSGEIGCSNLYTLIWAGRIVDQCPDHSTFTEDRAARLDRYAALYGPGWLWYEPPLSGPSSITARKAICLENHPAWRHQTDNMGHYQIAMGFRRRKLAVSRSNSLPAGGAPSKPRRRPQKLPTEPDEDGPTVFWSVLLDTGATFPCLYEGDLQRLGIDLLTYAAQSARNIATADDAKIMRIYELHVTIASDLTQNTDTITLGTVAIPVVALPGSAPDDASDPACAPDRLSGIIPFHTCYVSSVPCNFKIWMGAERNSVLGAGRFPAKKVDDGTSTPARQRLLLETAALGTPTRVVFEHNLADVVLRDTDEGNQGNLLISSSDASVVYTVEDLKTPQGQEGLKVKGRFTRGAPAA
ncbi:hypothetical protein B0T16DRAFT_453014 [Cercophora newfieldiana]|uniref:Uncharacterized protein n=1 Tax=Cercophora newfieldiana TaxID=92897 RepID=A0AA39YU92_9PEZI|nr:hypothetical protein B0T16DRAFT_453014 [Cercophora newfieldiana]